MKKQALFSLVVIFLLFPHLSYSKNINKGGNQSPLTYIKIFTPDYTVYTYDKNSLNYVPEYSCNERFDIEHDYFGPVKQYDPILSTSVLCSNVYEGLLVPKYKYVNFPGDVENTNIGNLPLQTWSVRAYCEEYYYLDEAHFVSLQSPIQIILHCLDHNSLP